MASKTVLSVIRSDLLILLTTRRKRSVTLRKMQYNNSVGDCPAEICELFADIFASVYNVGTCDSETVAVSDPSDAELMNSTEYIFF
jgi:DNA-binding helix-hairpin-helix protein with protein kinase domain